jgi:hypothetical protein
VMRTAGTAAPPCGTPGHTADDLTVAIPQTALDADGKETVRWVGVLEEITVGGADGPFSLTSAAVAPAQRGLVALRVNYPYQAATMTAYVPNGFDPNLANPIEEGDVKVVGGNAGGDLLPPPPDDAHNPDNFGAYKGPYGLGRMLALGGKTVRPFRRLISGQAIYRREVFQ